MWIKMVVVMTVVMAKNNNEGTESNSFSRVLASMSVVEKGKLC